MIFYSWPPYIKLYSIHGCESEWWKAVCEFILQRLDIVAKLSLAKTPTLLQLGLTEVALYPHDLATHSPQPTCESIILNKFAALHAIRIEDGHL